MLCGNLVSVILLVSTLFMTVTKTVTETTSEDSIFRITFEDTTRNPLRQKRSVFFDHGYGSRLQAGTNVAKAGSVLRDVYGKHGPGKRSSNVENLNLDSMKDLQRIKRIISDYGYGSRLQAGENVADSYNREGLFGIAGPGKRNAEMADFDMLSKRIDTDYGFGSRLQAANNVAMDWDRNELFGIRGPGKRSDIEEQNEKKLKKRIAIDFGYGSRSQAAENAAKTSSNGDLFGVYGPGKRNSVETISSESPENKILKRTSISDYGYGSRLQAAENIATASSNGDLFGVDGPGK